MYLTEHRNLSTRGQPNSHEHMTNSPLPIELNSPHLPQLHSVSSSSITHLAPLVFSNTSSDSNNINTNNNSHESVLSKNANTNAKTNSSKTKRSAQVRQEYQSPYRQLPQRKVQHEHTLNISTRETSLPASLPQTAPESSKNTSLSSPWLTSSTSTPHLTSSHPTTTLTINNDKETKTTPFLSPAWSPRVIQPSTRNTPMQPQEMIHNNKMNTTSNNNSSTSSSSTSTTTNGCRNTKNNNVSNKVKNVNNSYSRNRELPPLSQTISHSSRNKKNCFLQNKFHESTLAHNHTICNHFLTQPSLEHHFVCSTSSPPRPPSSSPESSLLLMMSLSPETLSSFSPQVSQKLEFNQNNVLLHKELHDQALQLTSLPSSSSTTTSALFTLNRPSKPIGLHKTTIQKNNNNNNIKLVMTEPTTSTNNTITKQMTKVNQYTKNGNINNTYNDVDSSSNTQRANVAVKVNQENSNAIQAITSRDADAILSGKTKTNTNADHCIMNVNSNGDSVDDMNFFRLSADELYSFGIEAARANQANETDNTCLSKSSVCNYVKLNSIQQHYAEEHQLHSLFTTMAQDLLSAEPCDIQQWMLQWFRQLQLTHTM